MSALRLLLGGRSLDAEEREMREEMRFHVDRQTQKNVAAGMSPEAARRAALVAFGGESRWTEDARDQIRSRPLDDFVRDLRYGVRTLRRNPGFSSAAVLTLSLGIAATVTVYSFIDAIYFRRLPVASADRLMRIYIHQRPDRDQSLGYAGFSLVRTGAPAFDAVIAHYSTAPLYVDFDGQSSEVQGAVVSASYFTALGLQPYLGRFFTSAEDAVPDRDLVAVIGYGLWRSRFGGNARIIGRTIGINGRRFTIVGVGPENFGGVLPTSTINELWIPMMTMRVGYRWCDGFQPSCNVMDVIGRLAPGSTVSQAQAQLGALSTRLAALVATNDSLATVVATPAFGVSPETRRTMAGLAELLSAIAGALLLIACANLAGLLLARGLARQREVTVRVSLGAARGRIVRQLFAETLVIAGLGGMLGVVLSLGAARGLTSFFRTDSEGYVHAFAISPNARVLIFAASVSLFTALIFGLLPAIETSRGDAGLRVRAGATGRTSRARVALVSVQSALCLALLVAAVLLVRSFDRVTSGQTLDPSHVALMRLRPRLVGYDSARAQAFLRDAKRRMEALPDVESVAMARGIGLIWGSTGHVRLRLAATATAATDRQPTIAYHEVTPGFFAALRVPLERGREFTDRDGPGAPRVTIVNESLARRLANDGAVIGRSVMLDDKEFEVVGVARDYLAHNASESSPSMAFVPFWQNDFEAQVDARVAIRVKGDASLAYPELRRAIAEVDPAVPVTETLPMTAQVANSFSDVRLGGRVLLTAAALALFLSGVGLYGVVAFLVTRRTREVGIRLAVGAEPRSIVALFMAQGLRPMATGAAAGVLLSLAVARPLSHWLYGVSPTDIAAYVTACVAVVIVALLASYLPARRAASVDPTIALRAE